MDNANIISTWGTKLTVKLSGAQDAAFISLTTAACPIASTSIEEQMSNV